MFKIHVDIKTFYPNLHFLYLQIAMKNMHTEFFVINFNLVT